MQEQVNYDEQVNKYEYMSHWKSLHTIMSKTNPGHQFVKLRKFDKQNFTKKDQLTLAHLFLQKLYLILYATEKKLKLYYSHQFYKDKNGLIFKVYEFDNGQNQRKNVKGIKMKELEKIDEEQPFLQVLNPCDELFQIIRKKCFDQRENNDVLNQYKHWDNKFKLVVPKQLLFSDVDCLKIRDIIKQMQKILLVQHYVFNVKLKNSLLSHLLRPNSTDNSQIGPLIQLYKVLIEKQMFLKGSNSDMTLDFSQLLDKLSESVHNFYSYFQKIEKIAEYKLNSASKQNQKQKTQKQFVIGANFLIILSPTRGKPAINEQMMENSEQKNEKNIKKIQIKAQNSIAPISGHVLKVQFTWEFVPCERSYYVLKISCFNNRKIEQLYFEDAQQFWIKLQNKKQFREIIGLDKYSMRYNKSNTEKMQVIFENKIPDCSVSQIIKEIDKIVALTIALDEVIQICERKQIQEVFQIEEFMIDHSIERFKRALIQIQEDNQKIRKVFKE